MEIPSTAYYYLPIMRHALNIYISCYNIWNQNQMCYCTKPPHRHSHSHFTFVKYSGRRRDLYSCIVELRTQYLIALFWQTNPKKRKMKNGIGSDCFWFNALCITYTHTLTYRCCSTAPLLAAKRYENTILLNEKLMQCNLLVGIFKRYNNSYTRVRAPVIGQSRRQWCAQQHQTQPSVAHRVRLIKGI